MPGFPFFQIPLLARFEILKHVDVYDLITLTFCSERTRALVESANIPLNQLDFSFIGSDDVGILVNDDFYMAAQFTSIKDGHCKEAHKSVVIFDKNFRVKRVVLLPNAPVHGSLEKMLTDHLMRTFQKVKDVYVYTDRTGTQNFPVWKYRKAINNFTSCPVETLSEEEINFILQELTINRKLTICPPSVDGFRFSAGFQSELVRIEQANWVHFDAILNSKSQKICLKGIEKPSVIQLNTMLKLWMSIEKMKELKVLQLELPSGEKFGDAFFTEVLDSIVHVRNLPEWAEIQRIDGKVADVMLDGNTGIWFSTRD